MRSVYVVLWDGWNFSCVAESKKCAQDIINRNMFSSMFEIKKFKLKDSQNTTSAFVVVDDCNEFLKIFDNEDECTKYIKTIEDVRNNCKIKKVNIRKGLNYLKEQLLCTMADVVDDEMIKKLSTYSGLELQQPQDIV